MNRDSYSTYDAKARFSELLRKVRSGRSITITYRGEPVAVLRPIEPSTNTETRIGQLEDRGMVSPCPARRGFAPIAKRPGALRRFLEERDRP